MTIKHIRPNQNRRMIQEFLNRQFVNINDDANVQKLNKAVSKIEKLLLKNKNKITSYTLAAFDPKIGVDNIDVKEVRNLIIENWSTFVSSTSDTNLTIIRAVMLGALQAISADKSLAGVIWFTARNIVPRYDLGREKEILTNFLKKIADEREEEITSIWSFGPNRKLVMPQIEPATISRIELETLFKASTIPTTIGDGGQNAGTISDGSWGKFYSTKVSQGLSEIVNRATKKQVQEILSNQQEFLSLNYFLQMRTQLLWWKAASFSQTFKKPYSEIPHGAVELAAALDFSLTVPGNYPQSVDYFFKNSLLSIFVADKVVKKMSDHVKNFAANKEILKEIFPNPQYDGGRTTLLTFLQAIVYDQAVPSKFKYHMGFSDTFEISSENFALWLFHDLQIPKISTK